MRRTRKPGEPVLFYEDAFYMLSNFAAFAVEWCDHVWMTAEHAYQAAKFDDLTIQEEIRKAKSAHDAKKIGKKYADMVRSDWSIAKLVVMEDILRHKLEQHPFIQKKLKETGDSIIMEDSPVDSFWGGGEERDGLNNLGRIWMKLRSEAFGQAASKTDINYR